MQVFLKDAAFKPEMNEFLGEQYMLLLRDAQMEDVIPQGAAPQNVNQMQTQEVKPRSFTPSRTRG